MMEDQLFRPVVARLYSAATILRITDHALSVGGMEIETVYARDETLSHLQLSSYRSPVLVERRSDVERM